jgi:hypothetical protein
MDMQAGKDAQQDRGAGQNTKEEDGACAVGHWTPRSRLD